jgi:hypothetical protein
MRLRPCWAELDEELADVFAESDDFFQSEEHGGGIARGYGIGQAPDPFVADEAEEAADGVGADRAVAEGGALVEDAEGVPQAAVGVLGDEAQSFGGDVEAAVGGYDGEAFFDVRDRDAVEVVALAAGVDGGRYFVRLGCGEYEEDVGGGLLKGFEEGVEGFRR